MSVDAVIVSWDAPEETAQAVLSVRAQTTPPTRVIVVDNHPEHPAARHDVVRSLAEVLCPDENLGFAGGAALGVRSSTADWVFVLNPDAVADPECIARLLDAADTRTGVVGAQVLLPDGRVNAGDNPVHLTGVTWAGHYGELPEAGRARETASVSGAAMLIRRSAYQEIGGFAESYFLYHEDVELCWRLRLEAWKVVFEPRAHVTHDYTFDNGPAKWFLLERNRLRTLVTCYSAPTLTLITPVAVAAEVAVVLKALREGWWIQKRRSYVSLWRERRETRERRRFVQSHRTVADGDLLELMTARLDSPFVGRVPTALEALLEAYRRLLVRLLS